MRTDAAPLIEAKKEYIEQLQQLIAKKVYGIFFEFFIKTVETNDDVELIFSDFQKQMEDIRTWNHEKVSEYTQSIVEDEEFFSQLITTVLILKTKIMTSFKIDNQQKNVQLKVPSNEHFIHRLFMIVGNHFYNNPFVFVVDDNKRINTERYKDCMTMILSAIEETITFFVPVKNILKEYIGVKEPEGVPTPKEEVREPTPEPEPKEPASSPDEVRRIPSENSEKEDLEDPVPTATPVPPPVPAQAPMVPEPPLVGSPLLPMAASSEATGGDTAKDVRTSEVYPEERIPFQASPTESPPQLSEGPQSFSRPPPATFDSDSDSSEPSEYEYEPEEQESEQGEPERESRY